MTMACGAQHDRTDSRKPRSGGPVKIGVVYHSVRLTLRHMARCLSVSSLQLKVLTRLCWRQASSAMHLQTGLLVRSFFNLFVCLFVCLFVLVLFGLVVFVCFFVCCVCLFANLLACFLA